MKDTRDRLNAVVFETPDYLRNLTGREKSEGLSGFARTALYKSAELSAVTLGLLRKGDRGEPIPDNETYWTVSHTLEFVAAVVAPFPVGIDIEKIKPVTPALLNKAAKPEEWALAADTGQETFCRFWTAKEAVLKAVGAGLGGLSRCTVVELQDEHQMRIEYEATNWTVSHFFGISGFIASISVPADRVAWRLELGTAG